MKIIHISREQSQMKKGQLGPEPMRYYVEPVVAELSYIRMDKDPFPTPQEAQVWFQLDERTKSAFVPLRIVNEERGTVLASLIGERQGRIVVWLPPTNFGQSTFSATESELEKIAVESEINEKSNGAL